MPEIFTRIAEKLEFHRVSYEHQLEIADAARLAGARFDGLEIKDEAPVVVDIRLIGEAELTDVLALAEQRWDQKTQSG